MHESLTNLKILRHQLICMKMCQTHCCPVKTARSWRSSLQNSPNANVVREVGDNVSATGVTHSSTHEMVNAQPLTCHYTCLLPATQASYKLESTSCRNSKMYKWPRRISRPGLLRRWMDHQWESIYKKMPTLCHSHPLFDTSCISGVSESWIGHNGCLRHYHTYKWRSNPMVPSICSCCQTKR